MIKKKNSRLAVPVDSGGMSLISLTKAAKYVSYSAEYLSLRARQKKFWAIKFNRDWLTTKQAVVEYSRKMKGKK